MKRSRLQEPRAKQGNVPPSPPARERAGRLALAVIALLSIAVVVLSVQLFRVTRDKPSSRFFFPSRGMPRNADGLMNPTATSTGEWGRLTSRAVMIEPTDNILTPEYFRPFSKAWVFTEAAAANLASFLRSAGLSPQQVANLMATGEYNPDRNEFRVLPSRELILSMDPETRATVYAELANCPENALQREPFRMRTDSADVWFQGCDLGTDVVAKMKSMLYRRGPFLMFSDPAWLMSDLSSDSERRVAMRALFRQRALFCSIHIEPDDDVEALSRYWGSGGRVLAVRPLIESIADAGGGDMDVTLLLPPLARSFLYSYPRPENTVFRDCHWTSLNYFRVAPDDRFADMETATDAFVSNYTVVTATNRLPGDVVVLQSEDGQVIHTCNYIADGVVFTKNGGTVHRPWVLLDLDTVIDLYSLKGPVKVDVLRRTEDMNLQ
jgi:hypothetical protein